MSANHALNERELLALGMSRATVATLRELQRTVAGASFTLPDIEALINAILGDVRSAGQQVRAENAMLRELIFSVIQDVRGAMGRVVDRAANLEALTSDFAHCRSRIQRMQQEIADLSATATVRTTDAGLARRVTDLENLIYGAP